MNEQPSPKLYLLLLRGPVDAPDYTPDEMQQIVRRWRAWTDGLRARGLYHAGDRLQDAPARVLRGPRGGEIHDGPFAEAKEIVGGYLVVPAADLDGAAAFARDCPGFDQGWSVEIRELYPRPV